MGIVFDPSSQSVHRLLDSAVQPATILPMLGRLALRLDEITPTSFQKYRVSS